MRADAITIGDLIRKTRGQGENLTTVVFRAKDTTLHNAEITNAAGEVVATVGMYIVVTDTSGTVREYEADDEVELLYRA